jgi:hypothetical protein
MLRDLSYKECDTGSNRPPLQPRLRCELRVRAFPLLLSRRNLSRRGSLFEVRDGRQPRNRCHE